MCRSDRIATPATVAPNQRKSSPFRLLLSLDSYLEDADHSSPSVTHRPHLFSCTLTGLLFISVLIGLEMMLYELFTHFQEIHPVLSESTHRKILARHLGVDAVSCFILAILGWQGRQFVPKSTNEKKTASQRLFTFQPVGFRIALFFFWYQVKNLYDTVIWDDGPEFIFHHVFSMITAYGCMSPYGCGHAYAIFFFGVSEVSTAVLCILANFDPEFGIPGLGDAMPWTKIAVGAVFIACFVLCRCILWPMNAYHFGSDVLAALKEQKNASRKNWMIFFLVSLSSLSVLQVAWLGQIFFTAKEELMKMGMI